MNEYRNTIEELLAQIESKRQKLYRAEAFGARVPVLERKLEGTRELLAQAVGRS